MERNYYRAKATDFITVLSKKFNLLLLSLAFFSPLAVADFSIQKAVPEFRDGKLFVTAEMDLVLSEKVEEALAKGIPLHIIFDVRLLRPRSILWDETIGQWSMTRKISYHALSSQYLVNDAADSKVESFTSLNQSLRHTGTLSEHEFPMTHFPGKDEVYALKMRVSLSIESLPAPLRPVAYTSLDWRLNSGWTKWQSQH